MPPRTLPRTLTFSLALFVRSLSLFAGWGFLTIASYTNMHILSEIWPRDLARTTSDAATAHASLLERSFPADFCAADDEWAGAGVAMVEADQTTLLPPSMLARLRLNAAPPPASLAGDTHTPRVALPPALAPSWSSSSARMLEFLCLPDGVGGAHHPLPVSEATRRYQAQLRWCALVYVIGCSIRSIWPRIDVRMRTAEGR